MRAKSRSGLGDVRLERYRLGELPAAEMEKIARRLQDDELLRERLRRLEASDEKLRRLYEREGVGQQLRARLAVERDTPLDRAFASGGRGHTPSARRSTAWWSLPAAAAACALLAVTLVPRLSGPRPGDLGTSGPRPVAEPAERVKGLKPHLSLHRKTLEGSELLHDGELAQRGDLIRVAYHSGGRRFGVILSIDGRGAVTVHLPQGGPQAEPLQPGPNVLLDHSYELDDAPRCERFYFVASEDPFEVRRVLDAAHDLVALRPIVQSQRLALPGDFDQYVVTLTKEENR